MFGRRDCRSTAPLDRVLQPALVHYFFSKRAEPSHTRRESEPTLMRSLRSVLSVTMVLAVSAALLVYHFSRSRDADAATRGPALTGAYPNWFSHIGKSQSEADAKVRGLYETLFTEKGPVGERLYQPVGSDMANI